MDPQRWDIVYITRSGKFFGFLNVVWLTLLDRIPTLAGYSYGGAWSIFRYADEFRTLARRFDPTRVSGISFIQSVGVLVWVRLAPLHKEPSQNNSLS